MYVIHSSIDVCKSNFSSFELLFMYLTNSNVKPVSDKSDKGGKFLELGHYYLVSEDEGNLNSKSTM